MIQDFYIFHFFCQHYSIMSTEEKPKGNQNEQTRGKNGTWDHLNLQLCFAFQAFFEQIWFLMQTNKGYFKTKNTHSEHKRTMSFWRKGKKKRLSLCENNRRGENFPPDMLTQCARRCSIGLRSRMLEGRGQAVFLSKGAPRMEGAFPFFRGLLTHTGAGGLHGTK